MHLDYVSKILLCIPLDIPFFCLYFHVPFDAYESLVEIEFI